MLPILSTVLGRTLALRCSSSGTLVVRLAEEACHRLSSTRTYVLAVDNLRLLHYVG